MTEIALSSTILASSGHWLCGWHTCQFWIVEWPLRWWWRDKATMMLLKDFSECSCSILLFKIELQFLFASLQGYLPRTHGQTIKQVARIICAVLVMLRHSALQSNAFLGLICSFKCYLPSVSFRQLQTTTSLGKSVRLIAWLSELVAFGWLQCPSRWQLANCFIGLWEEVNIFHCKGRRHSVTVIEERLQESCLPEWLLTVFCLHFSLYW